MSLDRMRQMELEAWLSAEIERRKALGEYNPDAKTIQQMLTVMYEIVRILGPKAKKGD